MTLQDYLTRARLYLRDSQATFWQDSQLITYTNQARVDVVRDTGATRAYVSFASTPGKERYFFETDLLPQVLAQNLPAQSIFIVNSISAELNPTLRYKLNYLPFTQFDALYRTIPYNYIPGIWTMYDYHSFFVAPVPSAAYVMDVDLVYYPTPLQANSDQEKALPDFLSDMVALGTCYWAFKYERNEEMSLVYQQTYTRELSYRQAQMPSWRVPSYYDQDLMHP